jgi:hypothetical protein
VDALLDDIGAHSMSHSIEDVQKNDLLISNSLRGSATEPVVTAPLQSTIPADGDNYEDESDPMRPPGYRKRHPIFNDASSSEDDAEDSFELTYPEDADVDVGLFRETKTTLIFSLGLFIPGSQ